MILFNSEVSDIILTGTIKEDSMYLTKKSRSTRKVTSHRLDAPTRKALEILAAKEKRSEAQIIELSVEEYFVKHFPELTTEEISQYE